MIYNYLTLNNNSGSSSDDVIYASYFDADMQSLYEESYTTDKDYFGYSNDDLIEISLYDSNYNLTYFGNIIPSISYSILSGSYIDVENEKVSYKYIKPFTNFIRYGPKILLNTQNILSQTVAASEGLNYVLYNFIRNVAGNSDYKLIVKEISTSRTEIRFSFAFNTTETAESKINAAKISAFANKKFLFLNIFDPLKNIIDNNPIFNSFNECEASFNYYKFAQLLGFKDTSTLETFIEEVYNGKDELYVNNNGTSTVTEAIQVEGIKKQLIDFIYTYNSLELTEDEILNAFNSIILLESQRQILKRTTLNSTDLTNILELFTTVIYTHILKNNIKDLLNQYSIRFFGKYKNALNFGNGRIIKILEHTSYLNSTTNTYNVQVKLDSPLPLDISLKSACWISNISLSPVLLKINLYTEPVSRKVLLTGTNFDINVNTLPSSNELYKPNEIFDIKGVLYSLKSKLNELNIDYTQFKNFIVYSSAELRTRLGYNKIDQYKQYKEQLNQIETSSSLVNNASISSSYINAYSSIESKQIDLLKTFDEYESYLLFNDYNKNYYNARIDLAVTYDKNNKDCLINQLPEFIQADIESEDYIKFVAMIGHFFDSIYLYVKKFPKLQSINSNYPKTYLNEFLNSFNWSNRDLKSKNADLYNYLFDNNNIASYFDYNKEILSRFANNLIYIYKTSGTKNAINAIRSIFGIPPELLQVHEYGNADYSINNNNYYNFESIEYLTQYTSDEYIKFEYNNDDYTYTLTDTNTTKNEELFNPVTYNSNNIYYEETYTASYAREFSGIRTVEFVFRISNTKNYNYNDIIDIVKKENSNGKLDWRIYLKRSLFGKNGILCFELYQNEKVIGYLKSDELPYFNGNLYNVFLTRKNIEIEDNDYYQLYPITEVYANTASIYNDIINAHIPKVYTLTVNQYDGYVKNFNSNTSVAIEYDFNSGISFSSGSFYFGNYNTANKPFVGNLDKIKIYTNMLDDDDIIEHSYNIDSISITNKKELYNNLVYLWSFDTPVDLSPTESIYNFKNILNCNDYYANNENSSYKYFQAYNFKPQAYYDSCSYIFTSSFPYQFDQITIFQALNANKFGPNYKNNIKIDKISQSVDSNLTPYDYSTHNRTIIGNDSNIIGAFISPSTYLENCIENFLGKDGIADVVGDPINLKFQKYIKLKERLAQFSKLNKKYIYPEEYYLVYKLFINFSFFNYLEKVIPARATLKKGLLIEATQLDRTKINCNNVYNDTSSKMLNFVNSNNSSDDTFLNLYTRPAINITTTNNFNFNCNLQSVYTPDYYQYNYGFIEIPDSVDDRNYITPLNKIFCNFTNNKFTYNSLMLENNKYTYTSVYNSSSITHTKNYKKYKLITSVNYSGSYEPVASTPSLTACSGDYNRYSYRHLSKFNEVGSRVSYTAIKSDNNTYPYIKGQNTRNTTINRRGNHNGSEPIISIPGFLSLRVDTETFPVHGYTTESVNIINDVSQSYTYFVKTPLTASITNSSSLEFYINNL